MVKNTSEMLKIVIPPEYQRKKCLKHVEKIYRALLKEVTRGKIPTLIACLVTVTHKDKVWLIDGGHRLAACKKLLKNNHVDMPLPVRDIQVKSERAVQKLFVKCNKVLRSAQLPTGCIDRVRRISKHFQNTYTSISGKPLFSETKPYRPRIRVSEFEEFIRKQLEKGFSETEIIQALTQYILELNTWPIARFLRKPTDTTRSLRGPLAKADAFKCRLGMVDIEEWEFCFPKK